MTGAIQGPAHTPAPPRAARSVPGSFQPAAPPPSAQAFLPDRLQQAALGTAVSDSHLPFVDGHDNDITILAATRIGQNAVTWLSPTLIKHWETGESLDQAIQKVARLHQQSYSHMHHPSLLTTRQEHAPVTHRLSLVFANSDYNRDGKLGFFDADLPDVAQEGHNLKQAYSEHGYQTQLYENLTDNQMLTALRSQLDQAGAGDELVIHYTGHGFSAGLAGVSSWLGYINPLQNAVVNSELQEFLDEARAQGIKVVLISDSCQSGYTVDYVRDKQIQGIARLLDQADGCKIPQARQNLAAMRALQAEINQLYDAPISIPLKGRENTFKLRQSSDALMDLPEKLDEKELHEPYFDLLRQRGDVRDQQFQLERQILQLELEQINKTKPAAEVKTLSDQARAEIQALKEQLPAIEARIQAIEEKQTAQDKVATDIQALVLERHQQIRTKEQELDRRLSESHGLLAQSIPAYRPQMADVVKQNWTFGASLLASPTLGPAAQLDVDYNLYELNRFQKVGLGFSAGLGTRAAKTTQTVWADLSNKWRAELGLTQMCGARGFSNHLHYGAQYKLSDQTRLSGGFDQSGNGATKLERLSPYLGMRWIVR